MQNIPGLTWKSPCEWQARRLTQMKGRGNGSGCMQDCILNYISVLSYTYADNSYSLRNNGKLFYSAKKTGYESYLL